MRCPANGVIGHVSAERKRWTESLTFSKETIESACNARGREIRVSSLHRNVVNH